MVFWVAVIPDSDVQVNPLAGTARMHVRNLPELDYYSPEGNGDLAALGPTWQTGYHNSTVSIDVVWKRPVTRLVNVHNRDQQSQSCRKRSRNRCPRSRHLRDPGVLSPYLT